jgi:hypothetical protein
MATDAAGVPLASTSQTALQGGITAQAFHRSTDSRGRGYRPRAPPRPGRRQVPPRGFRPCPRSVCEERRPEAGAKLIVSERAIVTPAVRTLVPAPRFLIAPGAANHSLGGNCVKRHRKNPLLLSQLHLLLTIERGGKLLSLERGPSPPA